MERRVAKKCDDHFTDLKNNIKKWLEEHEGTVVGKDNKPLMSEFLQYVYDYINHLDHYSIWSLLDKSSNKVRSYSR